NDTKTGLFRLFCAGNIKPDTIGPTHLVATTAGQFGIGTGTPRARLDVNGQIVAVNRLTLAQDTGDTTQTWHVDNDKGQFRLFWQPDIKEGTIGTGALVATTDGKVVIGGKVGIGTLDLQAIDDGLDVNGSVRILKGSNPIRFTKEFSN